MEMLEHIQRTERSRQEDDQRAGILLLCRKVEWVGVVQPGGEKAPERRSSNLPVSNRDLQKSWRGTLFQGV